MQLLEGWYAVASLKELKNQKILSLNRFGTTLAVWENNEKWIVTNDVCPHRGASLSLGCIKDNSLVCPFHGFEFNSAGECTHIPETGKAAPNLKVKVYKSKIAHDFLWVWYGNENNLSENPPWFEELNEDFHYGEFSEIWSVHFTRAIENQMDYAHVPFVHKTTIGGSQKDFPKRDFELTNEKIKTFLDNEDETQSAFFEFKFPNIWRLHLGKNLQIMMAFVPVDLNTTKLYLRTYQKFANIPILREIVASFFNISNRVILNQDKRVVTSQPSPTENLDWSNENLYPSDKGIAFFRGKLKNFR
jgi:phenylpropionate dioxygenase-like ring-hydroxylating dioxygenase large terminal subunit